MSIGSGGPGVETLVQTRPADKSLDLATRAHLNVVKKYAQPIYVADLSRGQDLKLETGGFTPETRELQAMRDDPAVAAYEFLQNLSYGLDYEPPPIVMLRLKDGRRIPFTGEPQDWPGDEDIADFEFITSCKEGITVSESVISRHDSSKPGLGFWGRGLKHAACFLLEDGEKTGTSIEINSIYTHAKSKKRHSWAGRYSLDETTDGRGVQLNMHWTELPSDDVKQTVVAVRKPPKHFIEALKNSPLTFLPMNGKYRGGQFVLGSREANGGIEYACRIGGLICEVLDEKIIGGVQHPIRMGYVDGTRFTVDRYSPRLLYLWHFAGGLDRQHTEYWAMISRGEDSQKVNNLEYLPRILRVGLNSGALGVDFWKGFLNRMYDAGFVREVSASQTQTDLSQGREIPVELMRLSSWDSEYDQLTEKGKATLQKAWDAFAADHPDIKAVDSDGNLTTFIDDYCERKIPHRYKVLITHGLDPLLRQIGNPPKQAVLLADEHKKEAVLAAAPIDLLNASEVMEVRAGEKTMSLDEAFTELGRHMEFKVNTGSHGKIGVISSENIGIIYIQGKPSNMFPKDKETLRAIASIVTHVKKLGGEVSGTFAEAGTSVANFRLDAKEQGERVVILATGEVRDTLQESRMSQLQLNISLPESHDLILVQAQSSFQKERDRVLAERNKKTESEILRDQLQAIEHRARRREGELKDLQDHIEERAQQRAREIIREREEAARKREEEARRLEEQRRAELEALARQRQEMAEVLAKVKAGDQRAIESLRAKQEDKEIRRLQELQQAVSRAEETLRVVNAQIRERAKKALLSVLVEGGKITTGTGTAIGAGYVTLEYAIPWLANRPEVQGVVITAANKLAEFKAGAKIPTVGGELAVVGTDYNPRFGYGLSANGLIISASDVQVLSRPQIEALARSSGESTERVEQLLREVIGPTIIRVEGMTPSYDTGGFYLTSFSDSMSLNKIGNFVEGITRAKADYREVILPRQRPARYLTRALYKAAMPLNTWAPLALRLGEKPIGFAGVNKANFRQNTYTGVWEVKVSDNEKDLVVYSGPATEEDLAFLKRKPTELDRENLLDTDTLRPDIRAAVEAIKSSNLTQDEKNEEALALWRQIYLYDNFTEKSQFPMDDLKKYTSALINHGIGPCGYAAYGATALIRSVGGAANVVGGIINEEYGGNLTAEELHGNILVYKESEGRWLHLEPQIGKATDRYLIGREGDGEVIEQREAIIRGVSGTAPEQLTSADLIETQYSITQMSGYAFASQVVPSDPSALSYLEAQKRVIDPRTGVPNPNNPQLREVINKIENARRMRAVLPYAAAGTAGAFSVVMANLIAGKMKKKPVANQPAEAVAKES